jgi:rubrerythrin
MTQWYCWECDAYFDVDDGVPEQCPYCDGDDIEEVDSSWVE